MCTIAKRQGTPKAQFIERFLPSGGAVTEVDEQPDDKRVPMPVQ
jgi:hypothetical protein